MTIQAYSQQGQKPKRKGGARDLLAQFAPGMTAMLPPAVGGE